MTAGDVSAVESAARAWQSEHYFYKQFSVAELAKCRTTLRCWMKLTPDRIWLGTHSYTLTCKKNHFHYLIIGALIFYFSTERESLFEDSLNVIFVEMVFL